MEEIWKDAVGYEGVYQVSNTGKVKSIDRRVKAGIKYNDTILRIGKILKPSLDRYGYYKCMLQRKNETIHRIVAKAFIPNPENKVQVNHINGIKSDNRVENLEWVTNSENIQKGVELNLFAYGSNHHNAKLNESKVLQIRAKYNKKTCSTYKLAKEYNVSRTLICYILRRKIWTNV